MRGRAAVAAVLLAAAAPAAAQQLPVSVALKLGGTHSSFSGRDADGLSSRLGVFGGVGIVTRPGGPVAVQVDLLWAQRGVDNDRANEITAIELTYLELPVLLRAAIPAIGPLAPYLLAGPQVAWRTGCRVFLTSGGAQERAQCAPDVTRRLDWGVTAGLGADLQVGGPGRALAEVRVAQGLRDINTRAPQLRNRGVTVVLGYRLGI